MNCTYSANCPNEAVATAISGFGTWRVWYCEEHLRRTKSFEFNAKIEYEPVK